MFIPPRQMVNAQRAFPQLHGATISRLIASFGCMMQLDYLWAGAARRGEKPRWP
jgi:hypothetical protein